MMGHAFSDTSSSMASHLTGSTTVNATVAQLSTVAPTLSTPSSVTSTPQSHSKTHARKLRYIGVNLSGAEFGKEVIPGVYNTNYVFPNMSAVAQLVSDGYNLFRVPFLMERMIPTDMGSGHLDEEYSALYVQTVTNITSMGVHVLVDPHNFGRFGGSIFTNTTAFEHFWKKVAGIFAADVKVLYDVQNEWHDETEENVVMMVQAAIDGIRSAGAKSTIFVEGNQWSGAWYWNQTNTPMAALKDPLDDIVFEMHQYLDSDGSGTSATCVSQNIGVERLAGATVWLKQNSLKGFLGEFAGGPNPTCKQALQGAMEHLVVNSEVWLGASWWAAGPWWPKDYWACFEPPWGIAYAYYNDWLKAYAPGSYA
ncbi:hypothetical protein PYCC9005_002762 [Savitreella phatthalungensis]